MPDYLQYFFGQRTAYVGRQSHRVERIFTQDRSDRTASGIGMGSSLPDVFRVLGPPEKTRVGDSNCGVPGQAFSMLYRDESMLVSFSRDGASCAEAPTKRVQFVVIKPAGSGSFTDT
jgi:hypothetical protein